MNYKHILAGCMLAAFCISVAGADTAQVVKSLDTIVSHKQDSVLPTPVANESKAAGKKETPKALIPQKTCPVMGSPIDKKLYIDYKGKRIYACCPGCLSELKSNPEKYIKVLKKKGEGVETISK